MVTREKVAAVSPKTNKVNVSTTSTLRIERPLKTIMGILSLGRVQNVKGKKRKKKKDERIYRKTGILEHEIEILDNYYSQMSKDYHATWQLPHSGGSLNLLGSRMHSNFVIFDN